jgi:hypothetical protein
MPFMLLIVEPLEQRQDRGIESGHAAYERMLNYSRNLQSRGMLLASNSLKSEAVRLKVRSGKPNVVDGPFTEAKEFIGGYFLLDCDSRAQALALAQECPAAEWATVEVREVGPCYE